MTGGVKAGGGGNEIDEGASVWRVLGLLEVVVYALPLPPPVPPGTTVGTGVVVVVVVLLIGGFDVAAGTGGVVPLLGDPPSQLLPQGIAKAKRPRS